MDSENIKKLSLLGVLFLLVSIYILFTVPPANQYEISLYGAYPLYFWLLLVGTMFVGAAVIIASATTTGDRNWVIGASLMFLTHVLMLLMPFIRGYQMYGRTDQMTHLGYARNIATTGELTANVYPPTHLLATVMADALGVNLTTVVMMIPVVFSGLYVGAMFYLLTYLFESREQVLFGLPFVMLPLLGSGHVAFRPFDLSTLLLPLVFYTLIKGGSGSAIAVRAVFTIILVASLLYHPLTALFLVGLLALYVAVQYVPEIEPRRVAPTNAFSLSAVIFISWYTNFVGIILRFAGIYDTLFGPQEGRPPVENYSETAEQTSIALIDIAGVFTFRYGIELILFGLGFGFLVMSLFLYYRGVYSPSRYAVMLGTATVTFAVVGLGFFFMDLIVSHERPFQIAKLCAAVVVGQTFYLLWTHVDWSRYHSGMKTGYISLGAFVFLLLAVITMFTVYPFAPASEANQQVTEMEMEGSKWLTEHGTNDTAALDHGIQYGDFYDANYGWTRDPPRSDAPPPDHFNYTEREYLGSSYEDDRYLIITRRARIVYPKLFSDYREEWRFTPGEFDRLEKDQTVARVYDNGDYTLYRVTADRYLSG